MNRIDVISQAPARHTPEPVRRLFPRIRNPCYVDGVVPVWRSLLGKTDGASHRNPARTQTMAPIGFESPALDKIAARPSRNRSAGAGEGKGVRQISAQALEKSRFEKGNEKIPAGPRRRDRAPGACGGGLANRRIRERASPRLLGLCRGAPHEARSPGKNSQLLEPNSLKMIARRETWQSIAKTPSRPPDASQPHNSSIHSNLGGRR